VTLEAPQKTYIFLVFWARFFPGLGQGHRDWMSHIPRTFFGPYGYSHWQLWDGFFGLHFLGTDFCKISVGVLFHIGFHNVSENLFLSFIFSFLVQKMHFVGFYLLFVGVTLQSVRTGHFHNNVWSLVFCQRCLELASGPKSFCTTLMRRWVLDASPARSDGMISF
jgi:hypothetical protein